MELQGYEHGPLDATFAALADPTRRAILARLAMGEASVAELAAPFDMTQPAISKHLRVLERAGLISAGRDAQRRPRRLEAQPLAQATAWLERYREFWETRFQQLDALLDGMQGPAHDDRSRHTDRSHGGSVRGASSPGGGARGSTGSGRSKESRTGSARSKNIRHKSKGDQ